MLSRLNVLKLIVATLVATLGFSLTAPAAEDAAGRRITIEIRKFEFVPAVPAVKPGDTIVWINRDIVPHTATAADESWDSGTIEAGGQWEMQVGPDLATAYFCRFHPAMTAALRIDGQASRGTAMQAGARSPE